ncbi:MAG: hypothetical protein JWP91_1222 [Fibrobacteres bacterium]|nr:hypothetical protein [Fibrobacterota bacterium]
MIQPESPISGPKARQDLLDRTERFVRDRLEANACGHDFHHIHRVRALALRIAPEAGADPFLVELGALLHDIADPKLNDTPEAGQRALAEFLDSCGLEACGLPAGFRARLEDVLERVSFGRELDGAPAAKSPELQAVQDADRLDALGAIGIARTFAYGGSKGHPMHDPESPPRRGLDQKAYREGKSTSANHFHEKLFLLKDRMNTATGRAIAEERHRYMATFLDRFMAEWDGKG